MQKPAARINHLFMGFIRSWFISGSNLRSQPQPQASSLCRWLQSPMSSHMTKKKKKLIPEQASTKKQVDFSSKDLSSLAAIPGLYPRNEAIIRRLDNHHKYCLLRPISIGNKSRILQTRPMSGGNTISILQTSAKLPHCSDGDVANVMELARIQEKYHKLFPSQIQENLGMFCCYPWSQEIRNQEDLGQLDDFFLEIKPLLESAISEYPDVIKELVSGSAAPERGKYFDAVSFLSSCGGRVLVRNNGDQVSLSTEHFRGKYILICCFDVPPPGYKSSELRSLIDFCNELYSTRDDFEMVMVARMNSLADDKVVFDSFFSGFPESCLVVPFEDSKRRNYICNLLGIYRRDYEFLILNKEGIVLSSLRWSLLEDHGAEAFPFTVDIMQEIYEKRLEMCALKSSLKQMLQSNDSSPAIVYKLNPTGGPREEMPISDLNNKHVGLYLCLEGSLIPDLLAVYEHCKEKNLDFEIVVVNVPITFSVEPRLYQKKVEGLLQKHNICDWWCLPFNNSVSRRLMRLIGMKFFGFNFDYDPYGDKLTVVGPLVKGGLDGLDPHCADVLTFHGIDAYPFTTEAAIQMIMNKARKFTLQSLLVDTLFRGNNKNDIISVKDLRGRKILLYVGTLCMNEASTRLDSAVSLYHKIKAKAPMFEMVYVDVGEDDVKRQIEIQSKMPWYVCPCDGTNFMALFGLVDLDREGLIGFDEDGHVCLLNHTSAVEYYDTYFEYFPLDDDDALYMCVASSFGYDLQV